MNMHAPCIHAEKRIGALLDIFFGCAPFGGVVWQNSVIAQWFGDGWVYVAPSEWMNVSHLLHIYFFRLYAYSAIVPRGNVSMCLCIGTLNLFHLNATTNVRDVVSYFIGRALTRNATKNCALIWRLRGSFFLCCVAYTWCDKLLCKNPHHTQKNK